MKRFLLVLVAIFTSIAAVGVVSTPTQAANASLQITGTLKSVDVTTSAVMLLAHDGTSVRVPLSANGKFSIAVPKKLVKKFSTAKRGRGSTLHVLTNGEYKGPVVLRKESKTKGYTRLSPNIKGKVNLGTIKMQTGFALGKVKTSVIDSSSTVRLKKGTPVSATARRDWGTGIVSTFATLSGDNASLGADADRDGLPNLADADMNGDGLPDAGQPESSTDVQGINDSLVLANRPTTKVMLTKILDLESSIEVNSNKNPAVTEEQIRAALAAGLKIEISLINIAEPTLTSIAIDCRKLSYCELGSKSMVRGAPGSPIDGKSLYELQASDGLILAPMSGNESRLTFYPGVASAAEGNLSGDVFDIITRVNNVVTSTEAKVVTSSVATPMALISVGGSNITSPRGEIAVPVASTSSIPVKFYRPQSFAKGSTSSLVDRGGLTYFVSIWPDDKSNTGYPCSVKSYSNLSSGLLKSSTTLPPVEQGIFDSEVTPVSNGGVLSFDLNAEQCLADQSNARHSFASNKQWRMELMGQDSDGNKVNVKTLFVAP